MSDIHITFPPNEGTPVIRKYKARIQELEKQLAAAVEAIKERQWDYKPGGTAIFCTFCNRDAGSGHPTNCFQEYFWGLSQAAEAYEARVRQEERERIKASLEDASCDYDKDGGPSIVLLSDVHKALSKKEGE